MSSVSWPLALSVIRARQTIPAMALLDGRRVVAWSDPSINLQCWFCFGDNERPILAAWVCLDRLAWVNLDRERPAFVLRSTILTTVPYPVPELPEVETVRSAMERHLLGASISEVWTSRKRLREPLPRARLDSLVGDRFTRATRRAKYLLLEVDSKRTLLVPPRHDRQSPVQKPPRATRPRGLQAESIQAGAIQAGIFGPTSFRDDSGVGTG